MSHWVRAIIEDATSANRTLPTHIEAGLKRMARIVEVSEVNQFRTDELANIADDIFTCLELAELSQLLRKATIEAGFQNYSLLVISQGRSAVFPSRICTTLGSDWLKHYFSKSYQYIDPVINRASQKDGDFLFSDLLHSCPLAEEFWKDAEQYKVGRNGFCHVSTRPDGARIAVSFMTSADAKSVSNNIRLNLYDLTAIADLAIECFCHLSCGHAASSEELTIQELRFLHTIATSQIPELAATKKSFFDSNKLLQNSIQKKLGAKTIFQAVSIASARSLFDCLPYYLDEVIKPFSRTDEL